MKRKSPKNTITACRLPICVARDEWGWTTLVSVVVQKRLNCYPYGETWIEEGGSYGGNTPGYKFTGKELDPETGLYYYGVRYYDPVLSRWISADPILEKYLPTIKGQKIREIPGFGGVYNPINLGLYTYSQSNPIILKDPDGRHTTGNHWKILDAALKGDYAVSKEAMAMMKAESQRVDKAYQGNVGEQTAIHAMAGYKVDGKMQSMEEAKVATQAEITNKISSAVQKANQGDFEGALKDLGSATHTGQDREQHQFGEWKHSSIWMAILKNPIGMLIHGLRDFFLGSKEKEQNVSATQEVMNSFKEQVGEDVFKNTMNYDSSKKQLTQEHPSAKE